MEGTPEMDRAKSRETPSKLRDADGMGNDFVFARGASLGTPAMSVLERKRVV